MAPARYLPRPVAVSAIQYTGENYAEVRDFGGISNIGRSRLGGAIEVGSPSGHVQARPGDWVVLEGGVLRVVRAAVFRDHYAPDDRCAGSNTTPQPGDHSRCAVCGGAVYIRSDGLVGVHRPRRRLVEAD